LFSRDSKRSANSAALRRGDTTNLSLSALLGDAGVHGFGLLGDAIPAKGGIDGGPAVAAHPAAASEIRQQRASPPGDRVGRVIYLQTVDAMPNELGGTAALGADDRFVGRPAFQNDDAERLIATGHCHDIARLE
jgi:hypothetical protein